MHVYPTASAHSIATRARFPGMPGVVHDYEMNLELTYSAQIVPGWTVQPMLAYVWHPSGGDWPNALVVGGRSIWRF